LPLTAVAPITVVRARLREIRVNKAGCMLFGLGALICRDPRSSTTRVNCPVFPEQVGEVPASQILARKRAKT